MAWSPRTSTGASLTLDQSGMVGSSPTQAGPLGAMRDDYYFARYPSDNYQEHKHGWMVL